MGDPDAGAAAADAEVPGPAPAAATPDPAAGRPGWGLLEPAVTFFLGLAGATIAVVTVAAARGDLPVGGGKVTLPTTLASLVGLWAVYAGGVWFASRTRGSGRPARDVGLRLDGWGDVGLGAAVGAASWVGVGILYWLVQLVGLLDAEDAARLDDRARDLAEAARGPGFVLLAVAIGLGAPLFEEVFFRGFLQPPLIRRAGVVPGVVLTAAVFALAHGRLLEVAGLFGFGLALGALARSTGRLGPSIVAHVVFNGMTLATLATVAR